MQADFIDEPGEIVSETLDAVSLLGLVAFSVAAQINCHDAVAQAEIFKLWLQVAAVVGPAVDQKERRRSAASVTIREVYAVSLKPWHVLSQIAMTLQSSIVSSSVKGPTPDRHPSNYARLSRPSSGRESNYVGLPRPRGNKPPRTAYAVASALPRAPIFT
jgi:hypothetical protein